MALESQIGDAGALFVGEDKIFELEVLDENDLPVNIATWSSIPFVVAASDNATAILTKSSSVIGTYNAVRASNSQRARVTLTDSEMNLFRAKTYRYSWKRDDDGFETILAYGDFVVEKATAP